MRAYVLAIAVLAACGGKRHGNAVPAECHFPSGRPCAPGDICLNTRGNECGYVECKPGHGLFGALPGCGRGEVPPVPGGPFDCDPSNLAFEIYHPPSRPCPIGSLWSIEDGSYGTCVPVAQCKPLPCNPAYEGDGCPSNYVCDATSSTCVPAS